MSVRVINIILLLQLCVHALPLTCVHVHAGAGIVDPVQAQVLPKPTASEQSRFP